MARLLLPPQQARSHLKTLLKEPGRIGLEGKLKYETRYFSTGEVEVRVSRLDLELLAEI